MQFNLHEQDIRDKYTKQGKAEGIRQTVINFVKAGVSFDLISKATGLTAEEIRVAVGGML